MLIVLSNLTFIFTYVRGVSYLYFTNVLFLSLSGFEKTSWASHIFACPERRGTDCLCSYTIV